MIGHLRHLLDQGNYVEELVAFKIGAASNGGCRNRLYNTIWYVDADIHLRREEIHDDFQRRADICQLGIIDKGDLGHYKASAMFHRLLYLFVLYRILGILLQLSLAVLAGILSGHKGDQEVCSLARLALPRILIHVLDRAESNDRPLSANLHTGLVQLCQRKEVS